MDGDRDLSHPAVRSIKVIKPKPTPPVDVGAQKQKAHEDALLAKKREIELKRLDLENYRLDRAMICPDKEEPDVGSIEWYLRLAADIGGDLVRFDEACEKVRANYAKDPKRGEEVITAMNNVRLDMRGGTPPPKLKSKQK
ncbi:MAG TPA: hypothetical protein VG944_05595 [Fimbriimonas sp.]|nr:hypothetical protein [Fimbriimonas sp.]